MIEQSQHKKTYTHAHTTHTHDIKTSHASFFQCNSWIDRELARKLLQLLILIFINVEALLDCGLQLLAVELPGLLHGVLHSSASGHTAFAAADAAGDAEAEEDAAAFGAAVSSGPSGLETPVLPATKRTLQRPPRSRRESNARISPPCPK